MRFVSMRCYTSENQASFCASVSYIQFLKVKTNLKVSRDATIRVKTILRIAL